MLFSIVEPRHPCAGGLTIDDIQRRLAQQVSELHLDERMREGREALNKTLATGQKKVSSAINNFWADVEAFRETQRKRNEERAMERASADEKGLSGESPQLTRNNTSTSTSVSGSASASASAETTSSFSWFGSRRSPPADANQTQQASVNTAGQRASAYISSWGTWASERRKEWQDRRISTTIPTTMASSSPPTPASPSDDAAPKTLTALPSVHEMHDSTTNDSNNNNNNNANSNNPNNRGRPEAEPSRRKSEDLTTPTSNLGRSISRRTKRWSSVLRKKEHRTSYNESDSESISSRKGSLDIVVPSSSAALTTADAPKSPLGQMHLQQEQEQEQESLDTTETTDGDQAVVAVDSNNAKDEPSKTEEERNREVTKSGATDDDDDDDSFEDAKM